MKSQGDHWIRFGLKVATQERSWKKKCWKSLNETCTTPTFSRHRLFHSFPAAACQVVGM